MESDVHRLPAHLGGDRHQDHPDFFQRISWSKSAAHDVERIPGGAEEKCKASIEVPRPHLALGQDGRNPLRYSRETEAEGSDPNAREDCHEERDCGCPMENDRADIASRRLIAWLSSGGGAPRTSRARPCVGG